MSGLPAALRRASRSLRWQVSAVLLLAAALCAFAAGRLSGDELRGSYREGADRLLVTAGRDFATDDAPGRVVGAAELERRLRAVLELDPSLRLAAVHRDGASGPRTVATSGDGRRSAVSDPAVERVLRTGAPHRGEREVGGRHTAVHVRRVALGGRVPAALELAYDLEPFDAAVSDRDRRIFVALAALLTAFTAFSAFVLARGIFRPLHFLQVATQRISRGELNTRLGWRRRDELGALARDFDGMAAALEESHGRLEALAHSDPLTGLPNHRHFQEELVAYAERSHRDGRPLALIVLDIDEFKKINDAHGHPVGDQVLAGAGRSLAAALQGLGVAARLGGDEFAVLLPDADDTRAKAICEAARAAVRASSPQRLPVTCSAGIALLPADTSDPVSLAQLADGALYWAKQSGRDRSRRYDPEQVLVVTDEQRAEFADVLESADAVRPVFQPIVRLQTGRVLAYEALARFEGRHRRPPSWWFAQAHRFGLGPRLEALAISAALAVPGRPPGVALSINVSPSALRSPEVCEVLPERLDGIIFEITENEPVFDPGALQVALEPLRERGARVAVDDAGGGYAGLQQVMRMRADYIKLDRALVCDVHLDRAKAALVSALVSFAASTGAEVCAEGVELEEELRVLAELGVTLAQGYALAYPAAPWVAVGPEATSVCRGPSRADPAARSRLVGASAGRGLRRPQ